MNKKRIVPLSLLFIVVLIITVFLTVKGIYTYAIITGVVDLVLIVLIIYNFGFYSGDAKAIFNRKLDKILSLYDSVLVQSLDIPNLNGRNIIVVELIEDMIDAQIELRKPIYFVRNNYSCSFVLLDQKEALVHVMKFNDDIVDPLDKFLK